MSGLSHTLLSKFCSTKLTYLSHHTRYKRLEYVYGISNDCTLPADEFKNFIHKHVVHPKSKQSVWPDLSWTRNTNSKPPKFQDMKCKRDTVLSYKVDDSSTREYGERTSRVSIRWITELKLYGDLTKHSFEHGVLIVIPEAMLWRLNAPHTDDTNTNRSNEDQKTDDTTKQSKAKVYRNRYKTEQFRQNPKHWNDSMHNMAIKVPSIYELNGVQCYDDYFMGWTDKDGFEAWFERYGHETKLGHRMKRNLAVDSADKTDKKNKRCLKGQVTGIWVDEWKDIAKEVFRSIATVVTIHPRNGHTKHHCTNKRRSQVLLVKTAHAKQW
eukprot:179405_1